MNTKRGYSLIEIAVGIAIIVIFLFCIGSLLNASYTNYSLILKRNEAMDFAIKEMEEILQSDEVFIGDYGYAENSMNARITVENVKSGDKVYQDKIYLVTVNVEYLKTPRSEEKMNIKLQSLKVVE